MAIYKNMDIHKSSAEWMKIATRKGDKPKGLRKVYFTCHPDDMEKYFEKVCEDIFKITDCDICFTPDMTFSIPEKYYETDILSCNIIVIPVTWKLLKEKSRAMDEDFVIAKNTKNAKNEKKVEIMILPLMMEPIDNFSAKIAEVMDLKQNSIVDKYAERFGNLQFLEPFGIDPTALPYEQRLSQYIKEILLDDEMIRRIRAAFDATIFLSYRKKNRNYANELMRLIHKNPKYQDIAIWYDEYLTPGEDFNVVI